jgi:hypothetical protein
MGKTKGNDRADSERETEAYTLGSWPQANRSGATSTLGQGQEEQSCLAIRFAYT